MRFVAILSIALFGILTVASRASADALVKLHEHPTLLKMLARNNELRRQVGLRPHRMSPELTQAAQDHANYMAKTSSFSHYTNGGPWARALRFRFFGGGVRENIAMGQPNIPNVFGVWQHSGGHWASIVSNTSEAGFGYAIGPGGTPYWVAVYGDTPPAPKPANQVASKSEAAPQVTAPAPAATAAAKAPTTPKAVVTTKPVAKAPTVVLKPVATTQAPALPAKTVAVAASKSVARTYTVSRPARRFFLFRRR